VTKLTGWIAGHPVVGFLVVFAAFPYLVPYKALATQVLIYGLFALGFNLLYGYTGLLSFGHAAYWGLGAYGTGIALAKLKVGSLWLALASGLGLAALGDAGEALEQDADPVGPLRVLAGRVQPRELGMAEQLHQRK
jgi:ABC-type branched-subunit amino acid transport system permease subunit